VKHHVAIRREALYIGTVEQIAGARFGAKSGDERCVLFRTTKSDYRMTPRKKPRQYPSPQYTCSARNKDFHGYDFPDFVIRTGASTP
jgi:hypothetical protein